MEAGKGVMVQTGLGSDQSCAALRLRSGLADSPALRRKAAQPAPEIAQGSTRHTVKSKSGLDPFGRFGTVENCGFPRKSAGRPREFFQKQGPVSKVRLTGTMKWRMGSIRLWRVVCGVAPQTFHPRPPPNGREICENEADGATPSAARGTHALPIFHYIVPV